MALYTENVARMDRIVSNLTIKDFNFIDKTINLTGNVNFKCLPYNEIEPLL